MLVDSVFVVKNSFVEKSMKYLKLSVDKLQFKNDLETGRRYINYQVLDKTYSKINELFPEG